MDYSKLNLMAIKAALEAGDAIMEVYGTDDFQVEQKADDSPLTIADKKAHTIISNQLSGTGIPILSEEGRGIPYSERSGWERFWLVDPLDGTKEFIKRNGEFTVNIALIENNRPVLGVIFVPVLGHLYFGMVDYGAYLIDDLTDINPYDLVTDTLVGVAHKLPLKEKTDTYTIVASRSHLSPATEDYINRQKERYGKVDTLSKGSSLKLCMVAEGRADVYPRFGPTSEWDTAAGHAIVTASGGLVTRQDGVSPLEYNKEDILNPWFIAKR